MNLTLHRVCVDEVDCCCCCDCDDAGAGFAGAGAAQRGGGGVQINAARAIGGNNVARGGKGAANEIPPAAIHDDAIVNIVEGGGSGGIHPDEIALDDIAFTI